MKGIDRLTLTSMVRQQTSLLKANQPRHVDVNTAHEKVTDQII
jgi:hypothetical protein